MELTTLELTTEISVLQAAADVVVDSIARAVAATLHDADVCGCRGCRARAEQTLAWADSLTFGVEEEVVL